MAALTDLWGDLNTAELVPTPVSILKEQAALLGKKTGNLIEARVETSFSGDGFSHRLLLVAPALDGYTYELLKFYHRAELYPVFAAGMQLENEEFFKKWLGTKLSSPETHQIITNLLSQSRS
jgi:hypothetical protein